MKLKRILSIALALVLALNLLGTAALADTQAFEPVADPSAAAQSQTPLYLYAQDADGVRHYMRQTRGASASDHGYAEKVTTTSPYSLYTTQAIDEAAVYTVVETECDGATEYLLQFYDAAGDKNYILYLMTSGVGPNSLTGETHAKHHFLWDEENQYFYQLEDETVYVLVMKNMEATYAATSALTGMTRNEWRITCAQASELDTDGVYPVILGSHSHSYTTLTPVDAQQHRLDCACGTQGTEYEDHSFTDGVCACGKREAVELTEGIYYLKGTVNGTTYYFRQTGTGEKVTYTSPYSLYTTTDSASATLVDVIAETGGFSLAYPYNSTNARIYVYDIGTDGTVDTGVNTKNAEAYHHFLWDSENQQLYQMEDEVKYVLALKELTNTNTQSEQIRVQAVAETELSDDVVAVQLQAHTQHSCDIWQVQTEATTSSTGLKTGTCTICDRQVEEVIPAITPEFSGISVSLKDELSLNFYVDATAFADGSYLDPYVVFTMAGRQTTVSAYKEQDGYYIFTFDGITPDKMDETVAVTLYADKSDGTVFSTTESYSVADYCYSALRSDSSGDTLRKLLVETLNFGAASEQYRSSDMAAEDLVNADLTEEEQALADTGDLRQLTSCRDFGSNTGKAVKWRGVSMLLGERVQMRLYFTAEDITDLTVHAQSDIGSWMLENDRIKTKNGMYCVDFGYLDPSQMDEAVTFTAYCGEQAVSGALCYSIESYAAVMLENADASQQLKQLVTAMIRYGDAAKDYVDRVYDLTEDVSYLGRTYETGDTQWFNWSASGFSIRFRGSGLQAKIVSNAPDAKNYAYLKVYVDGVEQTDILLDSTLQTVTLAEGLDPNVTHTVEVRKRNSPRSSTAGLLSMELLDGQKLAPAAAKEKLIEFVGDSLTVGYSAADVNKEYSAWSTATEDGTKTYSKQVADAFDAEYMVTAISGRGVVMNNGGAAGYLLPEIYPELDIYNIPGTDYDFALQPDVIVINLGTNDATNSGLDLDVFQTGVYNFIKTVRQNNPNAQIIWAYGLRSDKMTAEVDAAIQAAVAQLNTEGDANVHYLALELATDMHLNHPTAAAYAPSGELLIEKIAEITGW